MTIKSEFRRAWLGVPGEPGGLTALRFFCAFAVCGITLFIVGCLAVQLLLFAVRLA